MAKLLLICSVCLIRRFLVLLVDHSHPDPDPRVRTMRVVLSEVGGVAGWCRGLVEIVDIELRH